MDRWGDMVLRVALSQMGNRADAEDVFQDVFLRLLQTQPCLTSDEHLKAWLLRVTLNRCHDLQRKASRQSALPLTDEDVASEGDDAMASLLASEVWAQVASLPADLRAAVHLVYAEGYPTAEVARLLGCEPATVRTRLHRARRSLRAAMERQERLASIPSPAEPPARAQSRPERRPGCELFSAAPTSALPEGGCHE